MRITVAQGGDGGLLLCGVPFAQGQVRSGAGFALRDQAGQPLAVWWDERALWPDHSVKWLYLHARLPAGSNQLELVPDPGRADAQGPGSPRATGEGGLDGPPAGSPGASPAGPDGAVALGADGSLALGGTRLHWHQNHWLFAAGTGLAEIHPARPRTAPRLSAEGALVAQLVEASPIAPLVRYRQEREDGLRFDHLLRIDPVQACVHWQQRVSFHTSQVVCLEELTAVLRLPAGAWSWPSLETRPRRLSIPGPGRYALDDGPETEGRPWAAVHTERAWVVVEKGWQRAPLAMSAEGAQVRLELYPAASEPLPVHPGTSLRHAVRVTLSGRDAPAVAWSLDPEQACATGACGPLMACTERTRRLFPGYEQAVEACLQGGRLQRLEQEKDGRRSGPAPLEEEARQDEAYFGLVHYGDWPMGLGAYGTGRRMYADNEYDTAYAYFLHFLRTGLPIYGQTGYHAAVHMADVDSKATDGDLHFHGYYEQAEDHAGHRTPGGDLGHYWTDGLVLNYLLMGDLWSWEAARAQVAFLLRAFAGEGDDAVRRHFVGCERAVGWPLVALAGVAETAPDAEIVGAMRQMVAYLARFTADPDRELEEVVELDGRPLQWWRICQEDGTKPFMLGVVLEGLERYHRLTGDPAAVQAIVRLCEFLVQVMWVEGIEAFIYEWNAFNRPHREDNYPHYINMMVAPGLAYAYDVTGRAIFREVATRSFHAALWTLFSPGGGKEIGMVGRTSALVVGRLYAWRQQREQARAARLAPSPGLPFWFDGSAEELGRCAGLSLRHGQPRYEDGALVSSGDSFAVYGFRDPVDTDRGEIAFSFTPDWDCPPHPGPVAQRAYLHLCDRPFTRSCVSIISFYTGLHVRFHDCERNYVEVLETSVQEWRAGRQYRVAVSWDVEDGEAVLRIDGQERDRRRLGRRLSGAFKRLHLGHRPGNWRADGRIGELVLRLG